MAAGDARVVLAAIAGIALAIFLIVRGRLHPFVALLCGAFFMVLLDGTITIVALPSIGAGLRFSEQGLQWVLS